MTSGGGESAASSSHPRTVELIQFSRSPKCKGSEWPPWDRNGDGATECLQKPICSSTSRNIALACCPNMLQQNSASLELSGGQIRHFRATSNCKTPPPSTH